MASTTAGIETENTGPGEKITNDSETLDQNSALQNQATGPSTTINGNEDEIGAGAPATAEQQSEQTLPQAVSKPGAVAQFAMASLAGRTIEAKLLIPNTKVGIVIGKGGAMINHIRESSKASLDIAEPGQQNNNQSALPQERVLTFNGDFAAVYTAFQMVQQHLSVASQQQDPNNSTVVPPSLIETTILVPRNKTGGLIGRSGASINRVRNDSGATVKVGAPEDMILSEPDFRKCLISGTLDQVMQAFALVIHKLEETLAGAARLPGGGTSMHPHDHNRHHQSGHHHHGGHQNQGGHHHHPHHHMANQNTQNAVYMTGPAAHQPLAPGTMPVQFQVPNESMGAVIGRAGATINQIRQMSGAKVDIAQSVPGMPMRLVTVTGTPEQIQMAQYLIQVKMGGGALPTSSYGVVQMASTQAAATAATAGAAGPGGHHEYAIAQQQYYKDNQLENYGQYANQQEYQQQLQQMAAHQMQGAQGAGGYAMGGYPGF
eukprot:CAMPEP_0197285668 /NCGR_PEP_ID=MMETSP0890-20130614/1045_1 /TAXON_ID=44058 ORGANISM="Aureoumbra lagunensis, Strain CCMP1510" /NCGR_SAMPLE_ID=MMETSP0890 /ASSEMBLY_ACC=CAM_ASM_000533 /LENGTH=488 /DNA_ID=CAMNT_0042753429 /DNA_START=212 /DNA_END=1678 /DNA_ORIENTATION=-